MRFSYNVIAICYANVCSNVHIVLITYTICHEENLFVCHLLCCVCVQLYFSLDFQTICVRNYE
jgi:hypothetical protein